RSPFDARTQADRPDSLPGPPAKRGGLPGVSPMPIEVHCPNPTCAKVHVVKSKYAGMRGKCPACQAWMYIPVTATPAVVLRSVPGARSPLEEPAGARAAARARKKVAVPADEEEDGPDPRQARPARARPAPEPQPEEEAVEALAEEEAPARAAPYFS